MESTDGEREWTTVGVHGNIVEASWLALCDALVHKAMRLRSAGDQRQPVGGEDRLTGVK